MLNTNDVIATISASAIVQTIPYTTKELANDKKNIPLHIWDSIAGYYENPHTGQITKTYSPFRELMSQYPEYKNYTLAEGVSILKTAAQYAVQSYQRNITFNMIAKKFKDITLELTKAGSTVITLPNKSNITVEHKTDITKPYYVLTYHDTNNNPGEIYTTFTDDTTDLHQATYRMLEQYYTTD